MKQIKKYINKGIINRTRKKDVSRMSAKMACPFLRPCRPTTHYYREKQNKNSYKIKK